MKEITVDAKVENIEIVTDFVNSELEAADCPMKRQVQIDVAIDELFGNIAHYAYGEGTGEATIRVEFLDNPPSARLTFIDSGIPYNPLAKKDPDITLSAAERKIGGLGIFMVKKMASGIEYEYSENRNILTVTFSLG